MRHHTPRTGGPHTHTNYFLGLLQSTCPFFPEVCCHRMVTSNANYVNLFCDASGGICNNTAHTYIILQTFWGEKENEVMDVLKSLILPASRTDNSGAKVYDVWPQSSISKRSLRQVKARAAGKLRKKDPGDHWYFSCPYLKQFHFFFGMTGNKKNGAMSAILNGQDDKDRTCLPLIISIPVPNIVSCFSHIICVFSFIIVHVYIFAYNTFLLKILEVKSHGVLLNSICLGLWKVAPPTHPTLMWRPPLFRSHYSMGDNNH